MSAVPALAASPEDRPVDLGDSSKGAAASHASGGSSFIRTLIGLIVVIGLIYGVYWFLRRMKGETPSGAMRRSGKGLEQVATLPVGTNRSLHLVRVGSELLLVGAAEHGVTPIRRYDAEEARQLGLENGDELEGSGNGQLALLEGEPLSASIAQTETNGAPAQAPARPARFDTFAIRAIQALRKSTVRR